MRAVLVALCMFWFGHALAAPVAPQPVGEVRLKEIARVAGVRENPLTGYGLVFGLSGSGDSARNRATMQSVANTLRTYGVNVSLEDLASRNVAAVIVTAKLPAFAEPGQPLDVQVASSGDARSLSGGTLMLAPLSGPDGRIYAIAQGSISVGGYQFEGPTASIQKNHPTVGVIPSGATVEQAPSAQYTGDGRQLSILLNEPDFTMANRVVLALQSSLPGTDARCHRSPPIHQGRGRARRRTGHPIGNRMSMGNDLTTEAIRLAMGMHELRAENASRNIASANTPGAHATRLDFASTQGLLERAAAPAPSDEDSLMNSLSVAASRPLASESVDADGTGVNLDAEVASMASANLEYQALTESLNRHFGLMHLAITGRN